MQNEVSTHRHGPRTQRFLAQWVVLGSKCCERGMPKMLSPEEGKLISLLADSLSSILLILKLWEADMIPLIL